MDRCEADTPRHYRFRRCESCKNLATESCDLAFDIQRPVRLPHSECAISGTGTDPPGETILDRGSTTTVHNNRTVQAATYWPARSTVTMQTSSSKSDLPANSDTSFKTAAHSCSE
jgi:hypothetical protein